MKDQLPNPQNDLPTDQAPHVSTIHDLVENSRAHDLHAANPQTGKGTHHNEAKIIQEKNTKTVEPNNPKSENPGPEYIDEKDLQPFQAGKPTI